MFTNPQEHRSLNWFCLHSMKHGRKMFLPFQIFDVWLPSENAGQPLQLTNNLFVKAHRRIEHIANNHNDSIAQAINLFFWFSVLFLPLWWMCVCFFSFHYISTRCCLLALVHIFSLEHSKTMPLHNSCTNIQNLYRKFPYWKLKPKMVILEFYSRTIQKFTSEKNSSNNGHI